MKTIMSLLDFLDETVAFLTFDRVHYAINLFDWHRLISLDIKDISIILIVVFSFMAYHEL
ncbi:hypothetical protein LCGC14_3128510 [marine sediment metagenome]|uniref:Uncharacterized protein n=1 Tax=marine sediment metagenome TaxID=412755 RepID=A0A0F8WP67_9ZZZZ